MTANREVVVQAEITTKILVAQELTPASFARFGTVIVPQPDGVAFGPADAQLDLAQGIPRFYAMEIEGRGTEFTRITRHRCVTQTLAAVSGGGWLLAVAPPIDPNNADANPDPDDIQAFVVPGDVAVMLYRSTWHAGPLLPVGARKSFFNLELADTNVTDHQNSYLDRAFGLRVEVHRRTPSTTPS